MTWFISNLGHTVAAAPLHARPEPGLRRAQRPDAHRVRASAWCMGCCTWQPTTEILFLCSYDNCGKTFVDVSALRKHAHVHNEKQYICTGPNCGKVSSPGSQSERALVPHTYCLLLWYALEPCCTYLLSNTKHLEMFLFNWICLPLPIPYTEYFYHSGCTCPVFILSSWAVLLFIIVLFFLRFTS